ncbi:hypothetical protein KRR40_34460 [Niabella defluvii]|nr:hypothetical protein KRR40_34460 [Niabella sp. I65]
MVKLERDFYKSLSQLADRYGIQPKPSPSHAFPYNISWTLSDIKEQLKAKKLTGRKSG